MRKNGPAHLPICLQRKNESDCMTIKLYGVKVSMFSGKTRSHLIKQGIDFTEVSPSLPHYNKHILPKLGRRIMPVIEMEDGTIVQDTTDIIDYLQNSGLTKTSVYPKDPLENLVALILELFGDEGLIRPAMHYRWSFKERGGNFISHGFGGQAGPDADVATKMKVEKAIGYFSGLLPMLGVTPETAPEVERAYVEILQILEPHFARHPYMLGANPTLADYGMVCSLYAHLGRDPVPASLMKNIAPYLYRWTERMNAPHDDMSDMPYYREAEGLPETLGPLLGYIEKYFLPELVMNVAVLDALAGGAAGEKATINPAHAVLGFGAFDHGGVTLQCAVRPAKMILLQRVTDCFDAMNAEDKKRALEYLTPSGLAPILTLTSKHRLGRKDHTEVWA